MIGLKNFNSTVRFYKDNYLRKKQETYKAQKDKHDLARKSYSEYDSAGKKKVDEFGEKLRHSQGDVETLAEIIDFCSHVFEQFQKNMIESAKMKNIIQKVNELSATNVGMLINPEEKGPVSIMRKQANAIHALIKEAENPSVGVYLSELRARQIVEVIDFALKKEPHEKILNQAKWAEEDIYNQIKMK